ncbi:MAG: hypothetical protein U9N33_09395 [Campylobacterota bacterium]|nr:hypothetical protein [Campylobacterota bacterium]
MIFRIIFYLSFFTILFSDDDILISLQDTKINAQLRSFSMQRHYDEVIEKPYGIFREHDQYLKTSKNHLNHSTCYD